MDTAFVEVKYQVRLAPPAASTEHVASDWIVVTLSGPLSQLNALPVIMAKDQPSNGDNPRGLRVESATTRQINLEWERNDNTATPSQRPSTYALDVTTLTYSTTPARINDAAAGTANWDLLQAQTAFTNTYYRHPSRGDDSSATYLEAAVSRTYRVFPWHNNRYGYPEIAPGSTNAGTAPEAVSGLRVSADGIDKLKLKWNMVPMSQDGGAPITGYLIQVNQDRDDDATLADSLRALTGWCDVAVKKPSELEHTYDGDMISTTKVACLVSPSTTGETLVAGDARWFRVIALNKKNDSTSTVDVYEAAVGFSSARLTTDSQENAIAVPGRTATAAAGLKPSQPLAFIAQKATDDHSQISTQSGVLLLWDLPENATGDKPVAVTDYVIERKVDNEDWTTLEDGVFFNKTYWTDPRIPTATEQFVYRVAAKNTNGTSDWSNMAYYSATSMTDPDHTHNAAPMAVGTIADVTVMVDGMRTSTMAASSYFSDADGDTLTITASSGDATVATAMVNTDGMIVVTGVAVGSTTVTVTADDSNGGMVSQMFMVTVEAADTTPTAPSGVMASIDATAPDGTDVIVTWTDGANAEAHGVLLFNSDFSLTEHIARGHGRQPHVRKRGRRLLHRRGGGPGRPGRPGN